MTLEGNKGGHLLCSPKEYCAVITACAHELNSLAFTQQGILQEKDNTQKIKLFHSTLSKLKKGSDVLNSVKKLICISPPKLVPTRLESILKEDSPKTYSKSLVSVDSSHYNLGLSSILQCLGLRKYEITIRTRPKYLAVKYSFKTKTNLSAKSKQHLLFSLQDNTIYTHDSLEVICIKLSIQTLKLSNINISYSLQKDRGELIVHLPRSQQLALIG